MKYHTAPTGWFARSFLSAAAVLVLATGVTLAQQADRGGPPDRPGRANDGGPDGGPGGASDRRGGGQTPKNLAGAVEGYNLSPRGVPDALMIQVEGKISQVNCPPEMGAMLSQIAPIGDQVKVTAFSGPQASDHDVYRLVSITNSKGQSLGGQMARNGKTVHVDAAIKHLNYDREGAINGAILDNGDLVRVSSDSAQQLKLAAGQKLSIDGEARPTPLGCNVIQAQKINGTEISAPDDAGPGGPPSDDQGPPRQRNRDQRGGGDQQGQGRPSGRGARAGGPGGQPPADDGNGQDGPPRRGGRPGGPPQGDDPGPPPNR